MCRNSYTYLLFRSALRPGLRCALRLRVERSGSPAGSTLEVEQTHDTQSQRLNSTDHDRDTSNGLNGQRTMANVALCL